MIKSLKKEEESSFGSSVSIQEWVRMVVYWEKD